MHLTCLYYFTFTSIPIISWKHFLQRVSVYEHFEGTLLYNGISDHMIRLRLSINAFVRASSSVHVFVAMECNNLTGSKLYIRK